MNAIFSVFILGAPGVAAAFLRSRYDDRVNRKKLLVRCLVYAAVINLVLYGVLFAMGMHRFNFFEMGIRFRIKWLLLGAGLAVVCSCIGIPGLKKEECLDRIRRTFPAALVLTVTYAIFSPSALFLNNIEEFKISYFKVVPIILVCAFFLLSVLCVIPLCLVKEGMVRYYVSLLFGVTVGFYCQTNFLNPDLPQLDGVPIDWTVYSGESRVNILWWCGVCVLLPLILTFFKEKLMRKGIEILSWFFSAVQMVSLVVLIFTNPMDYSDNYGLCNEDEFTIGAKDNIVIFVPDTLEASTMEEYLESEAYPEGALDDFTFFPNTVSGGAPTHLGMIPLMTGSEYDPMQSLDDYFQKCWEDTPLYEDLHHNGYDVRFFTISDTLHGVSEREADNYELFSEDISIKKPVAFGVQLYKLNSFYSVPLCVKKQFFMMTDNLTDLLDRGMGACDIDNINFYRRMQEAGDLEVAYDKALRLYHLNGVHMPYVTDENLQYVPTGCYEQQTLQGNMKEIYCYIDKMKQAGVYDSSTIIITGDHGKSGEGNMRANPAFMIKYKQESHPFTRSEVPIHFRNVYATMAMTMTEAYAKYGPSVYDVTEESDMERLHTVNEGVMQLNTVDDAWTVSPYACRLIVPEDPTDTENFRVWDPFLLNRISYELGEKIDFRENKGKAAQIDYRLYKEQNAAVASNELCVCFALADEPDGDLTFHFTYDRIYGEKQTMFVYADGARIETFVCTPDMAGSDCKISVPKGKITDGTLVLRLVFPNAVTPNQLDRANPDSRILSVAFNSMWITE